MKRIKGSKVGGCGAGARGWSVRELLAARDRDAKRQERQRIKRAAAEMYAARWGASA